MSSAPGLYVMNKKLIFAVISVLILLIIITVSISAFQVDDSYTVITAKPTRNAVQNMLDVFSLQQNLGFISSDFFVISISFDNDINCIVLLASKSPTNISVTSSGSLRTYSGSTRSIVPYVWTSSGWSYPYNGRNPTNSFSVYASFHYYSSLTVSAAGSYAGFTGLNPNSVFGSSDSSSTSVLSYYTEYSDRLFGYDEAVSEAYSDGFDSGAADGYNMGYDVGYDVGYDYGHDRGYREGQTEGYSEGYSEGFDFGVENGYRQGFDEGEEEGYSEGYSEGESNGYSSGHQVGFDEGRDEGYTLGFDDGYSEGYTEGYSEGYETGYNIVYDDLQQPGTIEAIFTTKDSSGNTLYLAQEADIENFSIRYGFVPYDQLTDNIFEGYNLYVKTYDVTKYLENNPLDFDYPLPVLDVSGTDYLALYRKVNVTREYIDLYRIYSIVEVKIDQSFINQLNNQYNEGLNDADALVEGIGNITTKPIAALKNALDFEIFGLNIGVVAVGIVAILFAIWAYNKIRKVLPI